MEKLSIVAISDTHLVPIRNLHFPAGQQDLLIIAGDVLVSGSPDEWNYFLEDIYVIKHKFKRIVYVPGNHDRYVFNAPLLARKSLKDIGVDMLIDQEIKLYGLRIYGTPWVPTYGFWSYMTPELTLQHKFYANIPEGLDILITHGPPRWILDINKRQDHCGSWALRGKLLDLSKPPLVHVFGHIHPTGLQPRQTLWEGINCLNVAVNDDHMRPKHNPTVINLEGRVSG